MKKSDLTTALGSQGGKTVSNSTPNKLDMLLDKTLRDFHSLIEEYQYGNYIDESFITEEVLFLKYNDIDCIQDSLFNSIIEYFLNNDYQSTKFQWM